MVKMKVIFLDFDGVLNSTVSFITHKKAREAGKIHPYANPDASCVTLVNRLILADPSIRVVLSTSWRSLGTIEELRSILQYDFGLSDDAVGMVIDKTPLPKLGSRLRGYEIKEWLEENIDKYITHYVILDDNSDMLPSQLENFIKTSFDDGFTWANYQNARKILDLREDYFCIL
jgi:hypothetical protein